MICSKCKQELPTDSFNRSGIQTEARRGWQTYCKTCMYAYGKQHRQDNKEYYNTRNRKSCISPEKRLKLLLSTNTVDRSQLDYNWAWEKLQTQNFKCELTNIPFTWEARQPTALSIDRIDPTIGYTKENVRFVCWWINAAMGNWGYNKLIDLIKESNIAH